MWKQLMKELGIKWPPNPPAWQYGLFYFALTVTIILLLFMSTGCAPAPKAEHIEVVKEYVSTFEKLTGESADDISIVMGEPGKGNAAVCINYSKVVISEKVWNRLLPWHREVLVLHELGHCVLAYSHWTKGIMRSNALMIDDYEKERDNYLEEYRHGM